MGEERFCLSKEVDRDLSAGLSKCRWFQRAQPAAGVMEERVQSLKEGARGSQEA